MFKIFSVAAAIVAFATPSFAQYGPSQGSGIQLDIGPRGPSVHFGPSHQYQERRYDEPRRVDPCDRYRSDRYAFDRCRDDRR